MGLHEYYGRKERTRRKFKNEVMHRRIDFKKEFACRVDRNLLRWFGHMGSIYANYLMKRGK